MPFYKRHVVCVFHLGISHNSVYNFKLVTQGTDHLILFLHYWLLYVHVYVALHWFDFILAGLRAGKPRKHSRVWDSTFTGFQPQPSTSFLRRGPCQGASLSSSPALQNCAWDQKLGASRSLDRSSLGRLLLIILGADFAFQSVVRWWAGRNPGHWTCFTCMVGNQIE